MAMILTGFTDEASTTIKDQISITKELGWSHLSARTIGQANIHDIDDREFDQVIDLLDQHGLLVSEFGTLIGNWSKSITDDMSVTQGEVERCIVRMKKLDVRIARIMSYAQEPWGDNQYVKERLKRLRWIVDRFLDEGMIAAHENCMNWGGFSADHTLRLLDEVPGLKLIFDTGNPIFQRDRSKSEPFPWQDSYEFYQKVKHAIVHIHIKDAIVDSHGDVQYVYAGQGAGSIKEILIDLKEQNYNGFLAIEPHMGKVFHEEFKTQDASAEYRLYREYAQRFEQLVAEINHE